jgi:hypothetical protein
LLFHLLRRGRRFGTPAIIAVLAIPRVWLIASGTEPEVRFISVAISATTVQLGPVDLAVTPGTEPDRFVSHR